MDGFACVASKEDIRRNEYSLAINLYVTHSEEEEDLTGASQTASDWMEVSTAARQSIEAIVRAMKEEYGE